MTRERVEQWVAEYERLWRSQDPDNLGSLFTDDATYRTSPWAQPISGLPALQTFWAEGSEPGEEFTMSSSVVAVDGSTAVVRVAVEYQNPTEPWRDLWVLEFAEDGRCSAFEEWPFAPQQDDGQAH
ncbi:MAG TPA: nuclear transport factor 2 family protein [Nocardioidaceae bacterium]|nr:nuclear transport factor 2 family protein [Nocardioidaceae bacterium]